MQTYQDPPYHPFKEATTDALLDKEGFLVQLGTADGTVELATSGNLTIGVLAARAAPSRSAPAAGHLLDGLRKTVIQRTPATLISKV